MHIKKSLFFLFLLFGLLQYVEAAPAKARPDKIFEFNQGRILYFLDHQHVMVRTSSRLWEIGEIIAIKSQTPEVGIIGFLEVVRVEEAIAGDFEIKAKLVRHSRLHFVQTGDTVVKLDLSGDNKSYLGTTDLIIQESDKNVSARYRPLVFQGLLIGDTAQTLWKDEMLLTWYGDLSYGITNRLSVRTLVPANIYQAYNMKLKYKTYDSPSTTVSLGASVNTIPESNSTTVNLDFYWDSISSESTISHTFITVALVSFEKAEDTTAIRSLGTSSIQSGYELIMDDWGRVLVGPVYNFEKNALGGYLSYLKIWDRFHASITLSSTNVASFKASAQDGYYGLIDAFWRF
ncbi:MAG: hypothetical protein ACLGGX_06610 [Bdellovibrionia bacterium]